MKRNRFTIPDVIIFLIFIVQPIELVEMVLVLDLFTPIKNKLNSWLLDTVEMLPNFAVALIVLIAFVFLAKLMKNLVLKIFQRTYANAELSKIISKVIYFVVIISGLMLALTMLHLDKTVSSVLAGAGVIGIALSFAFQDIAANFISGLLMAARRPFEIGDVIEVEGYRGKVLNIHLRTTEIITLDGNEVLIPNRLVFGGSITNYYTTKSQRIELEVGISYGEDLEHVQKVVTDAVSQLPNLVETEKAEVLYTAFGDSSINFIVYYWVSYDNYFDFLRCKSEGIIAIKKAFDANDIVIPFPIRTLDFGIKGGEKLQSQLSTQSKE